MRVMMIMMIMMMIEGGVSTGGLLSPFRLASDEEKTRGSRYQIHIILEPPSDRLTRPGGWLV